MRLSEKLITRSLLFAAPIVLGSTIAIAPSRAASVASSTGTLLLENFSQTGNNPTTNTDTFGDAIAIAPDSTASGTSTADAVAVSEPALIQQQTSANAEGSGRNYFASGRGLSQTGISFNTTGGKFRFDFRATLDAIAQLTNPIPSERASASSFVGFGVFDSKNNLLDFFGASLSAGSPFNLVRSSSAIQFTSLPNLNQPLESALVDGYYAQYFDQGTELTVRGVTRSEAVATVPEPPMFAALVILPGLMWLKRRRAKAVPQEVLSSPDRRFE